MDKFKRTATAHEENRPSSPASSQIIQRSRHSPESEQGSAAIDRLDVYEVHFHNPRDTRQVWNIVWALAADVSNELPWWTFVTSSLTLSIGAGVHWDARCISGRTPC